MPEYLKPSSLLYPWYKTPDGMPSGSFGPTTARTCYGSSKNIGSMIMLAKEIELHK
jgi:hypothetical protein